MKTRKVFAVFSYLGYKGLCLLTLSFKSKNEVTYHEPIISFIRLRICLLSFQETDNRHSVTGIQFYFIL